MSDMISRQAAIDLAKDLIIPGADYLQHNQAIMNYEAELVRLPSAQPLVIHCTDCEGWHERQSILGFAISELPSAQPEIIHCKDCIWYELPSHKITENCVRWMKSNGILLPIKPDDFCSRAERRTDDCV